MNKVILNFWIVFKSENKDLFDRFSYKLVFEFFIYERTGLVEVYGDTRVKTMFPQYFCKD